MSSHLFPTNVLTNRTDLYYSIIVKVKQSINK